MVFTEDEQVVIRSLNPDIKYLARDMDGSLYGHSEKPLKQAAAWESIGNIYDLTPFTNVFQGITWKDKEPTYIRTGGTPAIFGKWTNVDDGLPGHDGLYIVSVVPAVNGKPTGEFFPESRIVSEYSVIKGWEIEQCETLEEPPKVTHWMPAPLPPEGEFWWPYPEGEDSRDATKWMSLAEPPKTKKDGDSREKKYYWIGNEYDGYADGNPVYYLWECSRCGYEHYGEQDTLTNYCPNCGAKMQMQPPEEENKNEVN